MSGNKKYIPYGQQVLDDEDRNAVVRALGSGWLTTGPAVERFESAVCSYVDAKHGVAVNSGTAALHSMMFALDIKPGDEVIVSPMTFAATANSVVFQGGTPVFADVLPGSLLLDPQSVAARLTHRTRAVVAVDYAGQACDYDALAEVLEGGDIALLSDGCHALGASFGERKVGAIALMTAFSFHPVKAITTCEGGMVTTNDDALTERLRLFRNHGIDKDHQTRTEGGTWHYDMVALGYNYRLSDVQCALGESQMKKLPGFLERRKTLAGLYDRAFAASDLPLEPLAVARPENHARHLYVIKFLGESGRKNRDMCFSALRSENYGANVHYIPVHMLSYYKNRFALSKGLCPVAEESFDRILTLPLHPAMGEEDVKNVVSILEKCLRMVK